MFQCKLVYMSMTNNYILTVIFKIFNCVLEKNGAYAQLQFFNQGREDLENIYQAELRG